MAEDLNSNSGSGGDDERRKFFHWRSTNVPIASELTYRYDPMEMKEKFLPTEKQREIYNSLVKVFSEDPMDKVNKRVYKYGGVVGQSKAKQEFVEWGKKIARERGIPSYNRELGIPLGQRYYEPQLISGTDTIVDFDDLNLYNNPAMQQMMDDVKRTVIIGLDIPHRVLQLRVGKEITPESMNLYMETLQHTLGGGAVVQEHMAEVHPGLTYDAYAKIITGDDDLKDQFDKRWVLDIDKEFHPERAEKLKKGIGEKLYIVTRNPTLRVRIADGGAIKRGAAIASTMAFVASYRLTGEAVIADFAYAAKHAQQIAMGEIMWNSRARADNEPGGIPYGYWADICAADSNLEPKPFLSALVEDLDEGKRQLDSALEAGAIAAVALENYWLGVYMSGGISFTSASAAVFTGNILDDFVYRFAELVNTYFKGHERLPSKWSVGRFITEMGVQYMMEVYEKYPTLMEYHWGGGLRMAVMGIVAPALVSVTTGDAMLGNMLVNYAIGLIAKEGWMRTGFSGQEVQDHIGMPYSCSLRAEEGGLIELRGLNTPYKSYTATHAAGAVVQAYAAMLARGSAWSTSPLIKAAFADPHLIFNFKEPRKEFARGALREFEPAGERDIVRPGRR